MNGNFLLDTNAIINILKDGCNLVKPGIYFFVSIITEMELLSYPKLTFEEEKIIHKLLNSSSIINIDDSIKEKAIDLRKKYLIKLPDAIICATAMSKKMKLVSDDEKLFKIKSLEVINLEKITRGN